jgi:hypothetical protein
MECADVQRTGVLVVRAWLEEGAEVGLRARVTHTLDVSRRGEIVLVAATQEEIYAAVRTWLEAFTAG